MSNFWKLNNSGDISRAKLTDWIIKNILRANLPSLTEKCAMKCSYSDKPTLIEVIQLRKN